MFRGKLILVYLIDSSKEFIGGIAVLNPRIEEFEGRKFIVGKIPESSDDWASGLRAVIAFDQVAHYLEFEDESDYFDKITRLPTTLQ